MKYDDIKVHNIKSAETYAQAWNIMYEEFPDHKDTDLLSEYEWVLVATNKSNVIGVITANKYIPKKALLCDIVVKPQYRSQGVGIKLLKGLGIYLIEKEGYTHLVGFTHKRNKEALNTYKRLHVTQQEMIVTTSDLAISRGCVEQMEMVLKAREQRKKK